MTREHDQGSRPRSGRLLSHRARFGLAIAAGVGVLVAGVACSQSTPPPHGVFCDSAGLACACNVVSEPQPVDTPPCSQAAHPGTTCCADTAWPESGGCECTTNEVACGIVAKYFEPIFDGGPTAGCVCSPGSYAQHGQAFGVTCGPGDWASPPSTVGVCCFYPPGFPGLLGGTACACGPAFVCAPGSTKVSSCGAASFPAATPVTCSGRTEVATCYGGDAGSTGLEAGQADE
jgi:hypothetical protein